MKCAWSRYRMENNIPNNNKWRPSLERLYYLKRGHLYPRQKAAPMSRDLFIESRSVLTRALKNLPETSETEIFTLVRHYYDNLHSNGSQPSFAELGLFLQEVGVLYGKKVDYLYDCVTTFAETIQNESKETARKSNREGVDDLAFEISPVSSRRTRSTFTLDEFVPLVLIPANNINRKASEQAPPPQLPRSYIEFERNGETQVERQLLDYEGEVIGMLEDFHVNWNTDASGQLCDDLDFFAQPGVHSVDRLDSFEYDDFLQSSREDYSDEDRIPSIQNVVTDILDEMLGEVAAPVTLSENDSRLAQAKCLDKDAALLDDQHTTVIIGMTRAKRPKLEVKDLNQNQSLRGWSSRLPSGAFYEFRIPKPMFEEVRLLKKNRISDLMSKMYRIRPYLKNLMFHNRLKKTWMEQMKILSLSYDSEFRGFDVDPQDGNGFKGYTQEEITETEISWLREKKRFKKYFGLEEDNAHSVSSIHTHLDSQSQDFNHSAEEGLEHVTCTNVALTTSQDMPCSSSNGGLSSWYRMIQTVIREADARNNFDVHHFADRILGLLSKERPSIHYGQLTQHFPPEDTARAFLALLVLTNAGNVELTNLGGELSVGDFEIKLISLDTSLHKKTSPFD